MMIDRERKKDRISGRNAYNKMEKLLERERAEEKPGAGILSRHPTVRERMRVRLTHTRPRTCSRATHRHRRRTTYICRHIRAGRIDRN